MFTNLFIAVYFCAIFGSSLSLTIFPNRKQMFPVQFPNAKSANSFRINRDNQIELLNCPEGFAFDIKDLKCSHISKSERISADPAQNEIACPANFRGTLPNSLNCRTFLNCWDGNGFKVACQEHLLYSNITGRCEWPETANCCEFWEKDPTKLVSDVY